LSLVARSSGKTKVKCVDINERALRFTKFNFEWNDFEEPTLILGNINSSSGRIFNTEATPQLWKELLGESTTYILSNPPFLPVPVDDDAISSRYGLFSSGGSTGEEFFQTLVRLSSVVLDRQDLSATLAVVSEFMNPNVDFGLRLSSWWNDGGPAQALLFTNEDALDASVYAQRRADSSKEASQWEQHLQQEGITSVSPGLMFLKRNPNKEITDSYSVDINQFLVPKTSEGSIWTPTNLDAREFTRYNLKDFLRH
jgi:methylase of polypeptide subunit release factors